MSKKILTFFVLGSLLFTNVDAMQQVQERQDTAAISLREVATEQVDNKQLNTVAAARVDVIADLATNQINAHTNAGVAIMHAITGAFKTIGTAVRPLMLTLRGCLKDCCTNVDDPEV